jgi:hypothetical protein
VRWNAHGQQLMDSEPEGVQDGRVQLVQGTVHAPGKDSVVRSLAAQCPVAKFCGKPGVAFIQPVMPDPCRQDQVGISVLGRDGPEDFERHQPGGVGPARPLGRCAVSKAALGGTVPFPPLGVAVAGIARSAVAAATWPPPWPAPEPPAGRRLSLRRRLFPDRLGCRRNRSFEHHAFKGSHATCPVGSGHHFFAGGLNPGQLHGVRTGSHQNALALD